MELIWFFPYKPILGLYLKWFENDCTISWISILLRYWSLFPLYQKDFETEYDAIDLNFKLSNDFSSKIDLYGFKNDPNEFLRPT